MKKRLMLNMAVFLLLAAGTVRLASGLIYLEPESWLVLSGDSTLHAYSAEAEDLRIDMTIEPSDGVLYDAIRAGKMTALIANVGVKNLKSEKAGLDKNMHKALKAEANPDISFVLSGYDVQPSTSAESFPIAAKGKLSIAGVTQDVDLAAVVFSGETVRIVGAKELLMTDYGIKPPSVLMIKAKNNVTVKFDLRLTKNK